MIVTAAQLYRVADGKFAIGARSRVPVNATRLGNGALGVGFWRARHLAGERERGLRANFGGETPILLDKEQARAVSGGIRPVTDL
jgi:hypothetical protein